jgi:hypothetical protein
MCQAKEFVWRLTEVAATLAKNAAILFYHIHAWSSFSLSFVLIYLAAV